MTDKYYVYLLRDPREADYHRSIFYIGKGTRVRALRHRTDALVALGIQDDPSEVDGEVQRAKDNRLREIHDAGLEEVIDVLVGPAMEPIAETTAFAVESALIEVLGHGQLNGLTNRVRGHKMRLMPARSLSVGSQAKEVELPSDIAAVIVPINGIWGGRDYAGTLLQTSDKEVWENSRRTWSRVSAARQRTIIDRAGTDNPVLLLALAADPSGTNANIIVGVYPISAVRESSDEQDRKGGYWRGTPNGEQKWVAGLMQEQVTVLVRPRGPVLGS